MAEPGGQNARTLAQESLWGVEAWEHALNALGDRAEALLPTVKAVCARQGITPYASACVVLGHSMTPAPSARCRRPERSLFPCGQRGPSWV